MVVALPLALLAAALIALWAVPADTPLLGLDHGSFARAAFGVAFLTWLALTGARRAGLGALARVLGGAATWAAIILGLTGVYAYRFEASDIADRVIAELFPGEPQIGQGGEVIVNRRLGGEFVVPRKVNGARVAFLFDTGASIVVLPARTPRRRRRRRRARLTTSRRHRQRRGDGGGDAPRSDRGRADRDAQCARAGRPPRRPRAKACSA